MRVLRPVRNLRRPRRRLLLSALALALGSWTAACAWWVARPGEPVETALGVSVPEGSRQLHAEEMALEAEAPFSAVYLSSALSVNDAMAYYASIATETDEATRRFVMPDGSIVEIAPARDVPATRLGPIHPVSDGVPLGTRSWIIVVRGAPPASTGVVAVPPLGES